MLTKCLLGIYLLIKRQKLGFKKSTITSLELKIVKVWEGCRILIRRLIEMTGGEDYEAKFFQFIYIKRFKEISYKIMRLVFSFNLSFFRLKLLSSYNKYSNY